MASTKTPNAAGVTILPTQAMQYGGEIPQFNHAFALFDSPKMGPI